MKIIKYVRRFFWSTIVRMKCGSHRGRINVNYRSSIGKNVHLGRNVHFNGIVISPGGKVLIGDNFHSGKDCMIIVQNHNYEGDAIPYDDTYLTKEVTIEENVWIGNRVIILGGVRIGEGAIIQAGAVVVKDVEVCGIAGGNPATVFRYRDIEHYNTLKQLGKFK